MIGVFENQKSEASFGCISLACGAIFLQRLGAHEEGFRMPLRDHVR